jgi:CheY-like chemotaxis protein
MTQPVILIADDEADAADLLGLLLGLHLPQAAVRVAHGGQTGLELAIRERPDAAVLDLEMPGLDGEALAFALRPAYPDRVVGQRGAARSDPRQRRVRPPLRQACRRRRPCRPAEGSFLSRVPSPARPRFRLQPMAASDEATVLRRDWHRHQRLVRMQHPTAEHLAAERIHQRLQLRAALPDAGGQRRARDREAGAAETASCLYNGK